MHKVITNSAYIDGFDDGYNEGYDDAIQLELEKLQEIIDEVFKARKSPGEEYKIHENDAGSQGWHIGKWDLINILSRVYGVDNSDIKISL